MGRLCYTYLSYTKNLAKCLVMKLYTIYNYILTSLGLLAGFGLIRTLPGLIDAPFTNLVTKLLTGLTTNGLNVLIFWPTTPKSRSTSSLPSF